MFTTPAAKRRLTVSSFGLAQPGASLRSSPGHPTSTFRLPTLPSGPLIPNPQSPIPNSFRYCGYFFDSETAQYHVRHRQYHPTLSTWLTRDPLIADINVYRYCGNAPLHKADPSGLIVRIVEVAPPGGHLIFHAKGTQEDLARHRANVQKALQQLDKFPDDLFDAMVKAGSVLYGTTDTDILKDYEKFAGTKAQLRAMIEREKNTSWTVLRQGGYKKALETISTENVF